MGLYGLPALATNQVGNVETLTDDLKITRVRFYKAPSRSMVNQSAHIVTVETDRGITGVGEGGTAFGHQGTQPLAQDQKIGYRRQVL